ncbi:uncharacterized protein LOC135942764 [Cloeon dipterum]|uniref:uncharacterized protein LOC135942764 n=1 Tax=Cloeon dipterum TaxID=197152 RepID=UPI003220501D
MDMDGGVRPIFPKPSPVDQVGMEDIQAYESEPDQYMKDPLELSSTTTASFDVPSSFMVGNVQSLNSSRDDRKRPKEDDFTQFVYPTLPCDYSKSGGTPWCAVCGKLLKSWDQKCLDMFTTNMQFESTCTYSEALAYAIRFYIVPDNAPSKTICCQCCLQLEETLRIEMRLKEIRSDLNKLFSKTVQHLVMGTIGNVWKRSDNLSQIQLDSTSFPVTGYDEKDVKCSVEEDSDSPVPVKIRIMDPASINKSVTHSTHVTRKPETVLRSPLKFNTEFQKFAIPDMEKHLEKKSINAAVKVSYPKQTMPTVCTQKPVTNSESEVDPLALSNLLTEINQFDPQTSNSNASLNRTVIFKPNQSVHAPHVYKRIATKSTMSLQPADKPVKPLVVKTAGGMKIFITPSKIEKRVVQLFPSPVASQNTQGPRILSVRPIKPMPNSNGSCSSSAVLQNNSIQPSKSPSAECHKQRRKSQHVVRDDSVVGKSVVLKKLKHNLKEVQRHNKTEADEQVSDQEQKTQEKKRKKLKLVSQKVDLSSVLESVKAEGKGDTSAIETSKRPRRSAFQKASKRLEIIATYDKNPMKWISSNSKVTESEEELEEVESSNDLKLIEARVVLEKIPERKFEDKKDESVTSKDVSYINIRPEDTHEAVESVCSQIEQVILESPPEKCKRRTLKKGKTPSFKKSSSELFVCDLCKLDFLKLDELRNHIELDHFSPSY